MVLRKKNFKHNCTSFSFSSYNFIFLKIMFFRKSFLLNNKIHLQLLKICGFNFIIVSFVIM